MERALVVDAIDEQYEELGKISSFIWENPELSFAEYKAHNYLTDFLEANGFEVNRKYPLETSFIAEYGDPGSVTVGICCEYDALPDIGHGCGHNLIAECSVAAALGVKKFLEHHADIKSKVVVFGTPAEEYGGGKADMLKYKVFSRCDFCMMAHPARYNLPDPVMIAVTQFKVTFKGRPSHSAAAPWDGINALDAAVSCYNNVSMLRQQITPSSRIHCVILKGGDVPYITPDYSELSFFVRALTDEEMRQLEKKVKNCATAAGEATGCECKFIPITTYNALRSNAALVKLYTKNAQSVGITFNYSGSKQGGSTDMGNVSIVVPSIHPKFKITADANAHTKPFCAAAILKENQEPTLKCAKALALTAVDVILNPNLLSEIKKEMENP